MPNNQVYICQSCGNKFKSNKGDVNRTPKYCSRKYGDLFVIRNRCGDASCTQDDPTMLNLPTMETKKQKTQVPAQVVPAQVVSDKMFEEIKLWVAQQAAKGLSARGIRRAVKRKWNIDYKM